MNYKYDPAIGRDNEIEELMFTILTPEKSALLIGKPGVGKTSIIEGLAYRIKNGKVPNTLKNFIIYKTSAAILNSGCMYSGMLEKRVIELFKCLKEQHNVILFIDEIHTLIGTGKNNYNNTLDIANIIKPFMTDNNIFLIGATTDYEYHYYIQDDQAFSRRFSNIVINEPSDINLEKILSYTLYKYSDMYKIKIDKKLVKSISISLVKYTSDKYRNIDNGYISNPDLAISIISRAYGYARLYDKKYITSKDFIYAYSHCDRVNGEFKLYNLNNKIININKTKQSNIIQFNQFKLK